MESALASTILSFIDELIDTDIGVIVCTMGDHNAARESLRLTHITGAAEQDTLPLIMFRFYEQNILFFNVIIDKWPAS
jgi:hypothetical protein